VQQADGLVNDLERISKMQLEQALKKSRAIFEGENLIDGYVAPSLIEQLIEEIHEGDCTKCAYYDYDPGMMGFPGSHKCKNRVPLEIIEDEGLSIKEFKCNNYIKRVRKD